MTTTSPPAAPTDGGKLFLTQALVSCRGALLSWVHLAPPGNRALAAAIADQVFPGARR